MFHRRGFYKSGLSASDTIVMSSNLVSTVNNGDAALGMLGNVIPRYQIIPSVFMAMLTFTSAITWSKMRIRDNKRVIIAV